MKKSYHYLYYRIMGCKRIINTWLLKTALRELKKMSYSIEYANQVRLVKNAKSPLMAFKWANTDQGFKFWRRINFLLS